MWAGAGRVSGMVLTLPVVSYLVEFANSPRWQPRILALATTILDSRKFGKRFWTAYREPIPIERLPHGLIAQILEVP